MISFDKDKVTFLVSEIKSAINMLNEIATMDYDAFFKDSHRVSSAKYNMIVAN